MSNEKKLAAECARKIKAVSNARGEEIEAIYREYQAKVKCLKQAEDQEGGLKKQQPNSTPPSSSTQNRTNPEE
jgi:hypothetical protein